MEDKKRGIKVEIFLFVVLFIAFAFFLAWVYRIFIGTRERISMEKQKTDCEDYSYEILNADYTGSRLMFELYNRQASKAISKVTVLGDPGREAYTGDLQPDASRNIIMDNITIGESFSVFVNNCTGNIKEFGIK